MVGSILLFFYLKLCVRPLIITLRFGRYYCSKECQSNDWPSHKLHHKTLRANRNETFVLEVVDGIFLEQREVLIREVAAEAISEARVMEEVLSELFLEQREALISEAASEAASEARVMEEIVSELFLEQRAALIREAVADAHADEQALARVLRDPRALNAALLAMGASLPDAAIDELLRAERVATAAERRVVEAARAGALPPAVARGLAETHCVSQLVLRALLERAAAAALPDLLATKLAAAPQVAAAAEAAAEAGICRAARAGALPAGAAGRLVAALLPPLSHLTALDPDVECSFCLGPVDLEDPAARYVFCCPGARFVCGACAVKHSAGAHAVLGHPFEAEATPVRLAVELRRFA